MFGINDNNQNTDTKPASDAPQETPTPLPPSPFMDTSAAPTDSPAPNPDPAASSTAPSLPDIPPLDATPAPPALPPMPPAAGSDDLVSLKSQALNNLAPLVGHLDQTPEEKFKTTMMLIQASDNSNLVNQAYEAANQISDEKARAQALLDVVNEINYFTQKDKSADKPVS